MTAYENSASLPLYSGASGDSARTVAAPRSNGFWVVLTSFLAIGYLSVGRAFAYIGIPWLSLYIGEVSLAAFVFFSPSTPRGGWRRVFWRAVALRRIRLILLASLCYGILQCLRGMAGGYPIFTSARDFAFHYYPIFLFLGILVGTQETEMLMRVARGLAWVNGCYGLAYVFFLNGLPLTVPGTSESSSAVPLFTEPLGSAIALLGLVAFEAKLRRVWHLLALNAVVMLFVQMRAEWLGFFLGLFLFAWCTRHLKQMAAAGALFVLLVAFMYVTDISLPSPEGRGGEISAAGIVARAIAPVNENKASALAPEEDMVGYKGTTVFRLFWWAEIWNRVHSSVTYTLFGFGYGYPVGELNPFIEVGTFIRTPHNDFFYVLGYTGWVGVLIWVLFQAELLRLLIRSYKITGQPFGLVLWLALITESMFGDFFEAPMGAIPFFLLVGIAIAPALLTTKGLSKGREQLSPLNSWPIANNKQGCPT